MQLTGTFDSSFVALLAEMWAELEAVLDSAGPIDSGSSSLHWHAGLRVQALKVEIVLLADRCDSTRWRELLGAAQVERLRSVVRGTLVLLDFNPLEHDTPAAQGAIVRAQNHLFDEVCRAMQSRPERLSRTTAGTARETVLRSA